jgi:hypothetical protein
MWHAFAKAGQRGDDAPRREIFIAARNAEHDAARHLQALESI